VSNQPKSKPQITRAEVEKYLASNGIDMKKEKMALLGIRGYYLDSMGKKGANDLGLFDDCLVWIDQESMATFNGNVDPSRYRKNVASLKVGVWRYKKGNHGSKAYGSYPAYRQADDVTVLRYVDGKAWKADTGKFGINIHHGSKGSGNGTSSLGCQTIPFSQWDAFKSYGDMLIARNGLSDFPYCLADTTQGRVVVNPQPEAPKGSDKVRRINPAGLQLIRDFESLYLESYPDPASPLGKACTKAKLKIQNYRKLAGWQKLSGSPWTIGWGTVQYPDGRKVKQGDTCTKEEAENWLLHEVAEKEKGVIEACKASVTDNEFSAMVSFTYNVGVGAFKGSTLLKKLNKGDKAGAAGQFLVWNKAGGVVMNGLIRRRKAEQALFLKA
jgi:GH24 family phage-related lysozyme (muramidase)